MVEVIHKVNSAEKVSLKICKINSKHDRNAILDYIRTHAPITQYRLAKNLGINRASIFQICKEFHFAGLIEFRIEIGNNNRTHKLITIPDGLKLTKKDLEEEK